MEEDELVTTKSHAVFEFTKRKRWADVLISELVNVAVLVFSQTGDIIHADAAVHAVTGYSEDQLIGKNFSDILQGQFHPFRQVRSQGTNHTNIHALIRFVAL
jgi:PAS domain S-box-containing protein